MADTGTAVPSGMAAPPGGSSESEKARLFAYMNVVEEVKAGEEAKLRLLLKTKDLEEQLEQQKRDQKDIYFYLNKKCDDAYNMIAQLEEQLSAEQQDREICEKGFEDQVSSLQNLLKNERETSKQTIQKLEDKLVALYSFETMKDKLEAQVAELQKALEEQRAETTRRVDDCELRFAAERRRMEKERQAALDELRHEMENSLEARMPTAVQKTLQINQLIRAELQQQSSTAINILDRDSAIQADAKAAKLELSLARGHEQEMLGKLSTYQRVIKKLNEQMAREKAERDKMSDDFLSAMRSKDAEAALLKAQLDDARVELAGQQESDRHDAAVWRFLCAAYHSHSGPRNFSLPDMPGMPSVPETGRHSEGRDDQVRRPAQLAAADIWVNNNHSDDGDADRDGDMGVDRDGEQSQLYRALSEESFIPAPALSAASASASASSLEEFYSRPLRQYPLPPSEHWSPAKEKVLVYLMRMLLLRYPHRFAAITAEAANNLHSNNAYSASASPNKGRTLLPQGLGSFALTQPSFASGGDDASTSSALSLAKPPASRQSPSSSRGGSRGSHPPSSRSVSYESMQSFRSIFVPESFAAEARAVDLVSTMSDSSLATLSRAGDDCTATSGSLPDLAPSSASAASRRSRAGTFKTTQASTFTSSDAQSTGGSSTGSTAAQSHAPSSPSRATNVGVSRGSPLKTKPAALDMRNLVSERIMNADAASLEALGWKFGNGFGRSKASDVSAISLTGRSVVAPEQRSAPGAPGASRSQGREGGNSRDRLPASAPAFAPASAPAHEDDDEVSLLSVSPRGLEFIVSESL